MSSCLLRFGLMAVILWGGYFWVRPGAGDLPPAEIRFEEQAEAAGCFHRHTMCQLSPKFANIMPWLTSVGAAVAAADYDNDGYADLYVIDSGPHQKNHLFHNRGDGTFEDVTDQAGVGCENEEGACMHAIWGDIDNSGLLSLYVVKWGAPTSFFITTATATSPTSARRPASIIGDTATRPHSSTSIATAIWTSSWGTISPRP